MPMSKEEMLARIQEGAKTMNAPEIDPGVIAKIQAEQSNRAQQGWNLPVAPAKPDPESEANRLIQEHIEQMKAQHAPTPSVPPEMQQAIQARANNPVNPETGMPYYSAPAQQNSPEDNARKQQMQFKTDYLRKMSQGQ